MSLFSREKRIDDYDGYSIGEVNIFGKKMGEWKFFNKKNTLKKIMIYDPQEDCKSPYKIFYKNGKVKEEGTYGHSIRFSYGSERIWIRNGPCKLYYETGELHTIFHTKIYRIYSDVNFFYEGPLTSFYKTGEILRNCYMKYNNVVGPYTITNKDGSIKSQDTYKEIQNVKIRKGVNFDEVLERGDLPKFSFFQSIDDIFKINEEI